MSGAAAQAQRIEAGYKAFNGHRFSQAEAEAYNRYTTEIEAERWPPTREFLKDQRHRFFCLTIGVQGM